jgi:hypothetical protein
LGEAVIWGTNVNVTDAMERFRDFVLEFGKADDPSIAEVRKRGASYADFRTCHNASAGYSLSLFTSLRWH